MIHLPLRDSSFGHCLFSNNPVPPTSFSKHIIWDRDVINENTIYTDYCIHEAPEGSTVWLIEPRELIPQYYDFVLKNATKFKQIWTHQADILNKYPNAKYVPLGGCWIKEEDHKIYSKTKNFSIIASAKRQLEGHRLRHQIVEGGGNSIDVFGNGYKAIDYKLEGLKDYRYQFVVENVKTDLWFTEKLIDCLVTGTIPIYWGSSSIKHLFNTDGFIEFDSLYELKDKLKLCDSAYYSSKKEAIKENFERAKEFILAEDYIYKYVLDITQR